MASWKKVAIAAFAAACVALTCVIPPASATSFSVDNSDLWGNPAENGWGLQIVQRAEIIFVTLYLYNANTTPVWYAAVLQPVGPTRWTGDLMQTGGPWFGTQPFNPAAVTVTRVGSMTFTPTSAREGVLSYSINGVSNTKDIERMTLRYDNYNGNYIGMLAYAAEGCPNPNDRGLFNNRIDFSITQSQSGANLAMISQQQGSTAVCSSSGDYGQDGQLGNSRQVTGSCSDGSGGGAVTTYYQMNTTPSGIMMNFTAPSSNPGSKGCTLKGTLVGIRQ
jgi:hypothetical protein